TVHGRALEQILLGRRIAREDGVQRRGELREVRPLAAGECRPVDDRVRVDVRGLQVVRDAVERAGDERRGGGLVDVLVDEDLEGLLRRVVSRLRGQQLVLQLRRKDRAGDRDRRERENEGQPPHRQHAAQSTGRKTRRSVLGDLGGEQLAQATQRAELERADRALVLAEHLRDLAARHVLDETEQEDLLLLGREVLHRAAQGVDLLATDRAIVRRRSVFGDAVR